MRAAGILTAISSLPSPYGIGCFSREAYEFADQLKKAGQTYWQILPLGPTGYGDSPYQSFSSFAGNPYFIDLDQLAEEGLLKKEEYRQVDFGSDPGSVDYEKLYLHRMEVLRIAFERADPQKEEGYQEFVRREADWLDDYCLYRAVKDRFHGASWSDWDEDIRFRRPEALDKYRKECSREISFRKFLQYQFMKQWVRLKAYVNSLGIRIIGDIPIYAAFDGSDAWSHPELFQFDEERRPVSVAGCPPDAFAADGQLWGNPLYDWPYHERTGYAWWIRRLQRCFDLYDVVRVDHFRGFDEYYSIPYSAPTAAYGQWVKGPGMKLFHALREVLPNADIIAEDLGYLTDSVMQLVKDSGYPGMKVIEFAFDSREGGDYLPHNYTPNCVAYTGTHDNQTLRAWYDELSPSDREMLDLYLGVEEGTSREQIVWGLIRLVLGSVAETAIIPIQDYLCLGSEGRMNHPSTLGANWKWRLTSGQITEGLLKKIAALTDVFQREALPAK